MQTNEWFTDADERLLKALSAVLSGIAGQGHAPVIDAKLTADIPQGMAQAREGIDRLILSAEHVRQGRNAEASLAEAPALLRQAADFITDEAVGDYIMAELRRRERRPYGSVMDQQMGIPAQDPQVLAPLRAASDPITDAGGRLRKLAAKLEKAQHPGSQIAEVKHAQLVDPAQRANRRS